MGGYILGIFQELLALPKARDQTLPTLTIDNGVEVGHVTIPLESPVLAAPGPLERLLPLKDFHKGGRKSISLCDHTTMVSPTKSTS
jgi:hypothetical protein